MLKGVLYLSNLTEQIKYYRFTFTFPKERELTNIFSISN